MDEYIFEPLSLYETQFKNQFHEEAKTYFDDLVTKSGVDAEENKKTAKKYYKAKSDYESASSKLGKFKGLKTFLIVMLVISAVAAFIGLVLLIQGNDDLAPILMLVIGIVVVAAMIVLLSTVIKKKIKEWSEKTQTAKKEMDELLALCWKQVAPLNKLFDWNMPADIISKVTSLLKLDKYFDREKLSYLNKKYGLRENTNPNSSTENVLSGAINGNPFLMVKTFNQVMRPYTYSGSITIHWTTTSYYNGQARTEHHSQTLVATVTKPAPVYYHNTELIFVNDAAPNLTFSREASRVNQMEEKELKKYIAKETKKLDEKFRKAIKNGGSYTKLANSDFEVLFGADDRNDEVEFRVLFTPLAQREIVKLVTSKTTYGDDFEMRKFKRLNFIRSSHSQVIDYVADPKKFIGFDIEEMKNRFVTYTDVFIKGLYFDLAPLLAIPIYQQTQSIETIYEDKFTTAVSSYEHESVANRYNKSIFAHPLTKTNVILKSHTNYTNKNTDSIKITAHSFDKVAHTEYVGVFGGDGYVHQVPVVWYEYIPIEQDTDMCVTTIDSSRSEFDEVRETKDYKDLVGKFSSYERNILSFIANGNVNNEMITKINQLFNKKGD